MFLIMLLKITETQLIVAAIWIETNGTDIHVVYRQSQCVLYTWLKSKYKAGMCVTMHTRIHIRCHTPALHVYILSTLPSPGMSCGVSRCHGDGWWLQKLVQEVGCRISAHGDVAIGYSLLALCRKYLHWACQQVVIGRERDVTRNSLIKYIHVQFTNNGSNIKNI